MVMLNRKDLNVLLVYMSVSIPKTVDEDWRTALARDDAKQRKIRLKNIARDDKQAEILFKEKQQKLSGLCLVLLQLKTKEELY